LGNKTKRMWTTTVTSSSRAASHHYSYVISCDYLTVCVTH